ncbi:hypothetical protein [Streptomyces sp. NPDC048411]
MNAFNAGGVGHVRTGRHNRWAIALLTWRTVRGRGRDRVTRLPFTTSAP